MDGICLRLWPDLSWSEGMNKCNYGTTLLEESISCPVIFFDGICQYLALLPLYRVSDNGFQFLGHKFLVYGRFLIVNGRKTTREHCSQESDAEVAGIKLSCPGYFASCYHHGCKQIYHEWLRNFTMLKIVFKKTNENV